MNIKVSYVVASDIAGGTNRNTVEVFPDSFDVEVLEGHVSVGRSHYLTPSRMVMRFNHCHTVGISYEMARSLLEKLKALDLADEVDEGAE